MSLKTALLVLKDVLNNEPIKESVERLIHDLEVEHQLSAGTLAYYYNNLIRIDMIESYQQKNSSHDMKKVNRKWTKNEKELLLEYIKQRQEEGALNITDILEEVAFLLNRGYQSVNYKYYTMIKENSKKEEASSPQSYQFTTIHEKDVPVLSTEVLYETSQHVQSKRTNFSPGDDDLLDILSGLISNVQQLPDIQLNDLLRSIYQLTNMALLNQDKVNKIENSKYEFQLENEQMRLQLKKQEQQLVNEKRRNDDLQKEVTKLVNEIKAYNKLGDSVKIQNLKAHNQRLNTIIGNFDGDLKVIS